MDDQQQPAATADNWSKDLTGPHLELAAYSDGKFLRVKAGPGTGKTFALMRRVTRLLDEGVAPESILAVSFTRTAAEDLVAKLKALGAPGADRVEATTLHSLALRMLSQEAVFQTLQRSPRMLMEFEKACMIADLAEQIGGVRKTKKLLKEFESYWATLQSEEPGEVQDEEKQKFQRILGDWLKRHDAVLLDELIVLMIRYIRQNPVAASFLGYKHVLVDEYQDLNRADQELIDLLAQDGTLTVIGDDDQSIYSFRHARPEGIITFNESHDPTKDVAILTCRRCPKQVVNMVNHLIKHNKHRFAGAPELGVHTSNPDGETFIVQHPDMYDEIDSIASYIKWYITNKGVGAGQVLVLAPRRKLGLAIRNQLFRLQVPARSFFNEDALEEAVAQEGLCLLNLLVNPSDNVALRTWLGLHVDSKLVKQYAAIEQLAGSSGVTVGDCFAKAVKGEIKAPGKCAPILARFSVLLDKIALAEGKTLAEVVDICWPGNEPNCDDVRVLALSLVAKHETLESFRDALVISISQPEIPSEEDGIVRIMSLHKSKGLTAKCVIVAGCNAGALPRVKGDTPLERELSIEEQRRLFYVALTRPTQTLVISAAAKMPAVEAVRQNIDVHRNEGVDAILQMSPFVAELGAAAPRTIVTSQWATQVGFTVERTLPTPTAE
ncbi:ATP-dependent helicase [Hymenobacter edaphi]|uniref:DNA 3'-5' helicase n=1 Tax=Hymenobacter edaphi TaxID=2211146 RepID=A0A328B8C2_9BACT|nr:ATP-dependent helicase [Hymenobacter edaphi]RAK62661.1 hypothetical protein DLM85_22600 [Hymenobacter edaphi]